MSFEKVTLYLKYRYAICKIKVFVISIFSNEKCYINYYVINRQCHWITNFHMYMAYLSHFAAKQNNLYFTLIN